ncbi:MAG TPA: ATP-binding protein [Candidatus Polarisedimenticolia bacterium]|nr:ATP-binding protein [Candidatus Polarisedimenticolia bacterium]
MRLGLRARLTALLLVLSLAPPGAVVWFTRNRVLSLVRAGDLGRIEDALSEFRAAIEREGADNIAALATVASLLEEDPRYRAPARPGGGPPSAVPIPNLSDAARRLMQDVGLDCLTILDAAGVVLSSGQAPADVGRVDSEKLRLSETSSSFLAETITPGIGRVLTLEARRAVTLPGGTLQVVGGRFIDSTFLRRLSPGGTVRALLLDRDGTILTAGDPENPLPEPPGWNDSSADRGDYDIRGVPHTFRMIRLSDQNGVAIGTLVAAVSQERLLRLSSSLTLLALTVVVAGTLGSLLIGYALTRGVTVPLRRLERMSEQIARESYEPIDAPEGTDEIGALVGAFNRMARSLSASRERLRQTERLAAAEDVARRVAHEIKNPLSPIALTLEGLVRTRQKRPEEFDQAFEEGVRTIQEEIQRMRGILEDFSRFGRLPPSRPRPADLNALVQSLLPLHAENSARARVDADLDPGLKPVPIDPDRMSEVINNLLVNAVQAIGPEGGAVTVSTRSREEGAELRVRDTGPGLSDEIRRRLFEPYVSTRSGGSGLGLAIARRIVLDHGGRIEAGNHPDGGAEIRILLPWAGAAGGEAGERGESAAAPEERAWRRS